VDASCPSLARLRGARWSWCHSGDGPRRLAQSRCPRRAQRSAPSTWSRGGRERTTPPADRGASLPSRRPAGEGFRSTLIAHCLAVWRASRRAEALSIPSRLQRPWCAQRGVSARLARGRLCQRRPSINTETWSARTRALRDPNGTQCIEGHQRVAQYAYGERIGRTAQLKLGCAAIIPDDTGKHIVLTRRTDNGRWC
jgi:hypothetical protein